MLSLRSLRLRVAENRLAPAGRGSESATAMSPSSDFFFGIDRSATIALALLIAAALALRLIGLNHQLWFDEIQTVLESVRPPLMAILTDFPSNNDHPFYSLLAKLSVMAFGEEPWIIRLPSVLFSVATIPLLYAFGLRITNRREAFLAAALLAFSFHHIWFAQNARGYSTLLFVTLATTFLTLKIIEAPKLKTYLLYAIIAAIGCYTHLTMVYVVIGQAMIVGLLLLLRQRSAFDPSIFVLPLIGFGLAAALTVLAYLPMVAEVTAFFEEKRVAPAQQVATPAWALIGTLRGVSLGYGGVAGAVAAFMLLAIGFASYVRQSPTLAALFVISAPLIMAAAVLLDRPIYPRFFFILAGFALLVLVRGAFVLSARGFKKAGAKVGTAIILAMIVASAVSLPPIYARPKQNFKGAIAFIERSAAEDEKIYVVGRNLNLPINLFYGKTWTQLSKPEAIREAASEPFWLAYTFGRSIRNQFPDLWQAIHAHCAPAEAFPGAIDDSEIVVMKCGAARDGAT